MRLLLVIAILATTISIQTICSTTLPRKDGYWFTSPDEASAFRLSEAVFETGVPKHRVDRELADYENVIRPRDSFEAPSGIRFKYGIGNFYVLAPFAAAGFGAMSYAPSFFGALSTCFVFAISRKLTSDIPAVCAAAVFGTATPILFQGNFGFTNMVSLAALLASLTITVYSRSWPLAGFASFSAVIVGLFRPEFWLLASTFGAAIAWQRGWIYDRTTRTALFGGLLAGAVVTAALLFAVYGNVDPFVALAGGTVAGEDGIQADNRNFFEKLTSVITPGRVLESILVYSLRLSPLLVLGVAGFVAVRTQSAEARLLAAVLVGCTLCFLLIFGGNIFNTGDGSPLRSSYTRYFLPVCAMASMLAAFLFQQLASLRLTGRLASVMVVCFCSLAGVVGTVGTSDLDTWHDRMQNAQEIEGAAKLLPANAIIVGDAHDRMVLSRPVLPPALFPENVRRQELLNVTDELIVQGHELFLPKSFTPNEYRIWFETDGRFKLQDAGRFYFQIESAA